MFGLIVRVYGCFSGMAVLMKRFRAIVSYDGTNYVGWQTQIKTNTIQETIEKVIESICCQPTSIVCSGRTDAGVHACGQVFHFDSDFDLTNEKWKVAINGHLPKDIHIHSVVQVKSDFHARFHAIGKRYDYLINFNEYDVFSRLYAYQCFSHLNVDKMKEASQIFLGKHDFSSFCVNSFATHPDQVRTITKIEFIQEQSQLRIVFEGKGFLRYMVRMIIGTLIEVGRGRITQEEVQNMLNLRSKTACRHNAKAHGLTLMSVFYNDGWEIE